MADEPDILGRDAPTRPAPSWLRPFAVVLVVLAAVGWFVVTRADNPAPVAAPTPPLGPISGEPGRNCDAAKAEGLAWSPPSGAVQPDGRLVAWRIRLCNRGTEPITVGALAPLSPSERNLPAEQVRALRREGVVTGETPADALPVRIAAGEQADVGIVSAVLGCPPAGTRSGLIASLGSGGQRKRIDMPVRLPGVVPAELWCNEYKRGGSGQSPLPLLRDGALTVTSQGSDIHVRVPLLNPNGLPVTVTGLHSPSPGVAVTSTSVVTLPPGGRGAATARLLVESCTRVFVDDPWQLTFIGRVEGAAAAVAPVRLGAGHWQADVVRQLCPAARPLPRATGQAELRVTAPRFRGDRAGYEVSQVIGNVTGRPLLLRAHPRSAPGMEFVRAEAIPGIQAALGRRTGASLTTRKLPAGESAFLTYIYRQKEDFDPVCQAPPVDHWRSPVDVIDTAGSPVKVGDEGLLTGTAPRVWSGGWLVDATTSCARPAHSGRAAPFLVFATRVGEDRDSHQRRYSLTAYGVPGEATATPTGFRLVGAYAHLPLPPPRLGAVSAGRLIGLTLSVPIRCPPPGLPITLAVSYRAASRSQPLPVLVDLSSVAVFAVQVC